MKRGVFACMCVCVVCVLYVGVCVCVSVCVFSARVLFFVCIMDKSVTILRFSNKLACALGDGVANDP